MSGADDPKPSGWNTARESERLEIVGELHGEVTVFQSVAIKEISNRGVLIETSFPLHVDSLHEFRLTLGDHSVVLKGRVAHCSISDVDQDVVRYRAGVEFVEASDRVLSVVAQFIAAVRDGRRTI